MNRAPLWVVVGNRTIARLLEAATPVAELLEVEVLVHPEGRLSARELKTDQPGRAFDSKGSGRHALQSEVEPQRQEALEFARRIAARLESARVHREVERIILIAAPEFLGLLRDVLTAHVRKMVIAEHSLDLASESAAEIRRRLPDRLYSTLEGR
jgi:protein required for attachment to host cells